MSTSSLQTPIIPGWFKGRQLNLEVSGDDCFMVSGPNMPETLIGIRQNEKGFFQAYLKESTEGEDTAKTEPDFTAKYHAWEAAFELYRQEMIL